MILLVMLNTSVINLTDAFLLMIIMLKMIVWWLLTVIL